MGLRQEKLHSIFLKEISDIIHFSLKDPKVGFVTVTDITISNDLNYAKVYVSFLGKDERNQAGLKALNHAKGHIRSELAKRIKVRKMPELTFLLDDSLERAERIEGIINKINHQ